MLALDARSMRAVVAAGKEAQRCVIAPANGRASSASSRAIRQGKEVVQSQRHRRHRRRLSSSVAVAAAAASSVDDDNSSPSPSQSNSTNKKKKRVVILGGTGRVGASTAAALAKPGGGGGGGEIELVLVGKPGEEGGGEKSKNNNNNNNNNNKGSPLLPPAVAAACKRVPELQQAISSIQQVDASDVEGLARCFEGADCIVHCAGPFQSGGAGAAASSSSSSSSLSSSNSSNSTGAVPAPLAAAIRAKVPYVDVCDDPDWAKLALSADADAKRAGVPAITTAGVFPGLSGLMAAQMCAVARLESAPFGVKVSPRDDDESESENTAAAAAAAARARAAAAGAASTSSSSSSSTTTTTTTTKTTKSTVTTFTETSIPEGASPSEPSRLRYSYYVAGSGGAGPAVLAATLLLAGREASAWKDGTRLSRPAFSEPFPADFGRFIGRKTVYLIDLPEVEAAAVDLRVPSVSARFATAPGVFNVGTVLLARLLPRSLLSDRGFASAAARVLAPLVAAADAALGVLPVAIRVDLELTPSSTTTATSTTTSNATTTAAEQQQQQQQASSSVFVHRDMATAVGACTAAFARELLLLSSSNGESSSAASAPPPGVCRPEALPAAARERILRDVAESSGAARLEVGSPPWALDSEPKRLGFGMYW